MATNDRTQPDLIINEQRLELALSAATMVCSVAGPLQELTAGEADPRIDAAYQLAIRIEQLAGVVIEALQDQDAPPDESLSEAWRTYLGPELARQRNRDDATG